MKYLDKGDWSSIILLRNSDYLFIKMFGEHIFPFFITSYFILLLIFLNIMNIQSLLFIRLLNIMNIQSLLFISLLITQGKN